MDIYNNLDVAEMLDRDAITSFEEGFMRGYNQA